MRSSSKSQKPRLAFPKRVYEGKLTTLHKKKPNGTNRLVVVTANGVPLNPRHDLSKHTYGLDWWKEGCGRKQLALALTADALGKEVALEWSHVIEEKFVSLLGDEEEWMTTDAEICMILELFSDKAAACIKHCGRYHPGN